MDWKLGTVIERRFVYGIVGFIRWLNSQVFSSNFYNSAFSSDRFW